MVFTKEGFFINIWYNVSSGKFVLIIKKEGFDWIDFYNKYGLLILKFCKYHQYIFLNKDEKNNEKIHELNSADPNRSRVVFLLDKIKASDEGENKNEEIKINHFFYLNH